MNRAIFISLSLVAAIAGREARAGQDTPASLPVYEVTKAGPSDSDLAALGRQFNIPRKSLVNTEGVVSFLDKGKYLAVPTVPIPDADVKEADLLRKQTKNKAPGIPIKVTAFDPAALSSLPVLDATTAVETTTQGLATAGLSPQFGTPQVGHNVFTLYTSNDQGGWNSQSANLDTTVTYSFTETNGYPLAGPDEQVQMTYDASGNVARLHYAASQLQQSSTSVVIISGTEAAQQIASFLPAGATISAMSLIYWAPPAPYWLGYPKDKHPKIILPWYAYTTTQMINPGGNAPTVITSKVQMIPATNDARFVPAVNLSVTTKDSIVIAKATVKGGTRPYAYLWGGSNPTTSIYRGDIIEYKPVTRLTEDLVQTYNFSLQRNEVVTVTVIDANGIAVNAQATVPVVLHANSSKKHKNVPGPSYGCESPNDPGGWTPARVAWQKAMGTAGGGGGTQSYCWEGDSAWPGDFIEPTKPGTLVASPWVYGDADYSNWGVNTADIVLNNNDGWADGWVEMQPGAPLADYSTSYLESPYYIPTVGINQNGFGTSATYNNPFPASWGPTGPNDTLYWLLQDNCNSLDQTDSNNLNVAQRWGPAFNGLHVMTGFDSTGTGNGTFEYDVAANLLRLNASSAPDTIVQAWFDSALSNSAGTPAAMGPLLDMGGTIIGSDFTDYYWHKGSVGPTIVPSDYPASEIAWWYIHGTSPSTLLP